MKDDLSPVLGSSDKVEPELIRNHVDKGNLVIKGFFDVEGFKPDGTLFFKDAGENATTQEFALFMLQVMFGKQGTASTDNPFAAAPTYSASASEYRLSLFTAGSPTTAMNYGTPVVTEITSSSALSPNTRQDFVNIAGTRIVHEGAGDTRSVTNFSTSPSVDNRPTFTATAGGITVTGAMVTLGPTATAGNTSTADNYIVAARAFTSPVVMTEDDTLKVKYTYQLTVSSS